MRPTAKPLSGCMVISLGLNSVTTEAIYNVLMIWVGLFILALAFIGFLPFAYLAMSVGLPLALDVLLYGALIVWLCKLMGWWSLQQPPVRQPRR